MMLLFFFVNIVCFDHHTAKFCMVYNLYTINQLRFVEICRCVACKFIFTDPGGFVPRHFCDLRLRATLLLSLGFCVLPACVFLP